MVAAHADPEAVSDGQLSCAVDDGFFHNGSDRKNGGLWRIDDGVEGIDAVGAEIGNRQGAMGELIGFEFVFLGSFGEIFDGGADFGEGFLLGVADDGSDEAVVDGDGHTEIHAFEADDGIDVESGVHGRHLSGCGGSCLE